MGLGKRHGEGSGAWPVDLMDLTDPRSMPGHAVRATYARVGPYMHARIRIGPASTASHRQAPHRQAERGPTPRPRPAPLAPPCPSAPPLSSVFGTVRYQFRR